MVGKKTPVVEASSDDDVPLSKKTASARRKTSSPAVVKREKKLPPPKAADTSDSDMPLAVAKLAKEKVKIEKKAEKTAKEIRGQEKKSTTTLAGTKRKASVKEEGGLVGKPKRAPAAKKLNYVKKEEETSDDDVPLAIKRKAPAKSTPEAASERKNKPVDTKAPVKGKGKATKEETPAEGEEEEEEEYKWWENQAETDGTQKWTTLEHNGVLFPPSYEPLPKNVKMKYAGVDVVLPLEAEEVAGFFGAMLETQHAANSTFTANFFKDFQGVIKEFGGAKDLSGKVCARY